MYTAKLISIIIAILSAFWLWTDQGYEPLIVCLASISTLASISIISNKKCESNGSIDNNSISLNSKTKINDSWQNILTKASENLIIFGGDISWIERDKDAIKKLFDKKTSVKVQVLCRRAEHENKEILSNLKNNLKQLIFSGAQTKFYVEQRSKETKIRGLISDPKLDYGEGLIISKISKKNIDRGTGLPGDEKNYEYLATHLFKTKINNNIKIYYELFQKIWETALIGIVLEEKKEYTTADYHKWLQYIPEYKDLREDDISLKTIQICNLFSLCHVVKTYKFPFTSSLIDAYQTQQLTLFSPCEVVSSTKPEKTILLPPILEQHDANIVIIDGMHRLYYSYFYKKINKVNCLVIKSKKKLPSEIIPLNHVRVRTEKAQNRKDCFTSFNPKLFRQIDILDSKLIIK